MSADRLRAFIALELSEEALRATTLAIRSLQAWAPEGIRWTPPEARHLTLKFLGDLDAELVPRLQAGIASRIAHEPPFGIQLAGLGAYPDARAARVVWLGVSKGAGPLARLARRIDAAAKRLGVARERRPFQAHVTLGRLRQPRRIHLERAQAPEPVTLEVARVTLFESRLDAAGATYVPLAQLPLPAGDEPGSPDFAPEPEEMPDGT
ncbi:MAG: RNA 2',3'-cyclic phosphodiesterase [Myxococcota bacterium]